MISESFLNCGVHLLDKARHGRFYLRKGFGPRAQQNYWDAWRGGKKHHSVRIPTELFSLLERAIESAKGELVVQPPNYKMLDYWNYRKALKQYCIEAEVPVIATDDLRHSTSEIYMAQGASRDDLRILFAHSSNSVTDRYIHDRGTRLEKVANEIQLFPGGTKLEQNRVIPIKLRKAGGR